jgi:hypothetical protein
MRLDECVFGLGLPRGLARPGSLAFGHGSAFRRRWPGWYTQGSRLSGELDVQPHRRAVFRRPNLHEIAELVREPHAAAVYLRSERA